jgi:hypothetical protein
MPSAKRRRLGLSAGTAAAILVAVIAIAGVACYVVLTAMSSESTQSSASESHSCVPSNSPDCASALVPHVDGSLPAAALGRAAA